MEEALLLARVQFGLNIAFHILFPSEQQRFFHGPLVLSEKRNRYSKG